MPAARAYAAQSAETPLAPYSIERRELRPNDVKFRFVIDMASLKQR